jgi:hypothetical protein
MYNDIKNEFVDKEPYLFPATRLLLTEIESKTPSKVELRKVYDPIETWQIRSTVSFHIDMPSWDEGNKIFFTHELLHIYFDYVLGMRVEHLTLPFLFRHFCNHDEEELHLLNQYINLINNLQHHKMVPYFVEYKFPMDKIILNYENPIGIFETLDIETKSEIDLTSSLHKYISAISFVNYLVLELYFPNPLIREKLRNSYSQEFDKKFVGLRALFLPLLNKWDQEYNDLPQIIRDINEKAKEYAEIS